MTVTKLIEVTKAKSKVVLDEELAFVLYKGELRKYKIKEGEELEEETYRIIRDEVLPKRAKLRCMNLLQARNYTEKELQNKLMTGGYDEEIRLIALEYVKSYGYVNDEQYARSYIASYLSTKSQKIMELELLRKGISKEVTRGIFEEMDGCVLEDEEKKLIQKYLRKKHFIVEEATREQKSKVFSYLYRKGFSMDLIKKSLVIEEEESL